MLDGVSNDTKFHGELEFGSWDCRDCMRYGPEMVNSQRITTIEWNLLSQDLLGSDLEYGSETRRVY